MAKRVQVLQYGAELREVDGTYDVAFDQSLAYSKATGVLSRNTAYNPLTIEGKKTVSFEIVRDLAEPGRTRPASRPLRRAAEDSSRRTTCSCPSATASSSPASTRASRT